MNKRMFWFLFCMFFANYAFGADSPSFLTWHTNIGKSDIYSISLQRSDHDVSILIPQNDDEKAFIQSQGNLPQKQHNVMLIKNDSFIALIDTGYPHTQETLKAALKSLSIDFKDITHVIVSHAHGDHIGGILDEKGNNNFPNATMLIDEKEFNYWDAQADRNNVRDAINAFAKKQYFSHDKPLLQHDTLEIRAIQAYGHTPGHNLISLNGADSGEKIVFVADLIHVYQIHKAQPQIHVIYDVDKIEGAKTREKFVKEFKQNKTQIIGAHMPYVEPTTID